jgi:Na+/melibiose symporter-like transporter
VGLSQGYWMLFFAILLQQFSANMSHGAVQGLIPDLVPEDQRGRASAVKAVFELLPIILVALTVAKLAGAGQIEGAIAATGGALLVIMLLSVLLVREKPLDEKPDTPLRVPMWRVLGMLAGFAVGAVSGLVSGGVAGALAGLVVWPLAGKGAAQAVGVGLGGLTAMVVAVVIGVWAGARATLGDEARHHPSFTWWIVNRLLFFAAANSIQGFAPFFLMSAFGLTREAAVDEASGLMMVVGIFTLSTALPGGWLSDRLGYRILVGAAGLIAAAGTLLLVSTMAAPSMPLVYVAGCIIGMGAGLFATTNWALGTELAPREEAGRYLGVSNLAGAGAGVVGAGIGGPMADLLDNYRSGLGHFAIFACYGVLFVLSTFSLLKVRGDGGYRQVE